MSLEPSPSYRSFREQAAHYFIRSHTKPPESPVVSPAAWLGQEMRDTEVDWRFELEEKEAAELEEQLLQLDRNDVALESISRIQLNLPLLERKSER